MKYQLDRFLYGLDQFHIQLSDEQIKQFMDYYELIIEKNKVMNLTAITDFDEVIEKHFLDSLSLIQFVDLNRRLRVIDMGTGAGFPGIPLKIAFPGLEVVLADSLQKKVIFLQDTIDQLGLKDISAVHGRAEDLARQKEYREKFDFCVSRALANLSTLSEYCLPFVSIGGQFVSYKSGSVEEEMEQAQKAIGVLGGKVRQVSKFMLGDNSRAFVIIDKIKGCPKQYPRKAGIPSRKPLK